MPSRAIFRMPNCQMGVPGVMNRLMTAVNTIRNMTAFRPRAMNLNGTPDSLTRMPRQIAQNRNPVKLFTTNSDTRKSTVPMSFVRGSRRWMTESPG